MIVEGRASRDVRIKLLHGRVRFGMTLPPRTRDVTVDAVRIRRHTDWKAREEPAGGSHVGHLDFLGDGTWRVVLRDRIGQSHARSKRRTTGKRRGHDLLEQHHVARVRVVFVDTVAVVAERLTILAFVEIAVVQLVPPSGSYGELRKSTLTQRYFSPRSSTDRGQGIRLNHVNFMLLPGRQKWVISPALRTPVNNQS